jgi:hypothetical protein
VTGYLRVRHRMLYSPVVRFENPNSGHTVTVVGTVHIAPAAYYERLRALINEMESAGALVCYESAGPVTDQEWAAASDEERAAWDGERRAYLENSKAAGRYFGWTDQWTALSPSASWRNTDMTYLEFVRRAGPQNLLSLQRGTEDFRGLTQLQQEALVGGGYAVVVRLAQFAWFRLLERLAVRLVGDAARRIDDVRLKDRNSHVLASLPADSDAVLPWGAGHLPGLAATLRKAGYRRRDTTWVTVGRLPGIWASGKAFWAGMKVFWAALGAPDDGVEVDANRAGPQAKRDRVADAGARRRTRTRP